TWNKGAHFIRVGGEYRWVRSRYHIWGNARGSFAFNGAFTGNSVADFLLGDPSSAALTSVFVGDLRYRYYGGLVNDDCKRTRRLGSGRFGASDGQPAIPHYLQLHQRLRSSDSYFRHGLPERCGGSDSAQPRQHDLHRVQRPDGDALRLSLELQPAAAGGQVSG